MRRLTQVLVGVAVFVAFPAGPDGIVSSLLDPGLLGRGFCVAQAAPRRPSRQAPRKAKPRRSRPALPNPVLPDDPSVPLKTSWERHLSAFFARTGPTYGAFVALDPRTGEVLAVSEHSRNPKGVRHPALEARFPAASVFKMVTAAALLEGSDVGVNTQVCYHGGRSALYPEHLRDSPRRDRTCRSLATAFAQSTNAVFGKLALKHLDAGRLLEMAERLGFNRLVVVGGQQTRSRARRARDALDLGRMAAGFTNAWLSPLHAAVLGAVVANGGVWPIGVQVEGESQAGSRVLSPRTAARLRSMMEMAATGGTGRKHLAGLARHGRGNAAVKTGTLTSRDGSGLFNTWMVGFYPAQAPEVAFAALISVAGGGGVKAGHLARYALETYIRLKKAREGRS